jgi:hypothetical protein
VGANIDVKAVGPGDRLRFDTGPFAPWDMQVPDRGGHATEVGFDCVGGNDQVPGDQGEHQVVGGPDLKHIEADPVGTDDDGEWGFAIRPDASEVTEARFTTYYLLWVDEVDDGTKLNDDSFCTSELSVQGQIGWGRNPESVAEGPVLPAAVPCPDPGTIPDPDPTESPDPDPEPTETEPPPPPADRITIRVSDRSVRRGTTVRFSGAIGATPESCEASRTLLLQSRRPGGRFQNVLVTGSMQDGRWASRQRMTRTRDWRIVAKPRSECERLASAVVRVRVRRSS